MKTNNIVSKIKKIFQNIFNTQKKFPIVKEAEDSQEENLEVTDKKQFLEVYEKLKKGEVDILSMEPDKSEKMCILLEEEIKLKEKLLEKKLSQIAQIKENIEKLDTIM